MSLTIKKSSGTSTPAPAGTHIARCVRLIDLGTQATEFKGQKKLQHKVLISWELPTEKHVFIEENGEEPFMVSSRFTANISNEKSSLRKLLTSWRGKVFTDDEVLAFNLETIVAKSCYLTVVHKDKPDGQGVYANIMGAMALPRGIVCPPQITPTLVFDLDNFTEETWNRLHERVQETIQLSPEWKAKAAAKPVLPTTAELKPKKPVTAPEPEGPGPEEHEDAGADPSDGADGDDVPF